MKRATFLLCLAFVSQMMMAQTALEIMVSNPIDKERTAEPVVLALNSYTDMMVRSALVTKNGQEIPCQLDDINGDGTFDQLCFLTNLGKREKQIFKVQLMDTGEPRMYESKVYVDMMLVNNKIKSSNKQNLYISSLTVDRGTNPYWMLHHHGPAFENELVAYRIYFDHRQTVDIYGKYRKGLELKETQFYPDEEQKSTGYGDDVLWVGNTLGCGTLRGWDGKEPQMLNDVIHRTFRIVCRGPLRTIVEVEDRGWKPLPDMERVTAHSFYILYADRRDVEVKVHFNRSMTDYTFATGLINIKNSKEYSNNKGLRGCWGTDWPVSAKDSVGHKRETVGLGIRIPMQYISNELPATKDNYTFVVRPVVDQLNYRFTFGSDNESFGYHSAKEWFEYLREWNHLQENPIHINTKLL